MDVTSDCSPQFVDGHPVRRPAPDRAGHLRAAHRRAAPSSRSARPPTPAPSVEGGRSGGGVGDWRKGTRADSTQAALRGLLHPNLQAYHASSCLPKPSRTGPGRPGGGTGTRPPRPPHGCHGTRADGARIAPQPPALAARTLVGHRLDISESAGQVRVSGGSSSVSAACRGGVAATGSGDGPAPTGRGGHGNPIVERAVRLIHLG